MPSWRIDCAGLVPDLDEARYPDRFQALAVARSLDPGDLFRGAPWSVHRVASQTPNTTAAEWLDCGYPPPPGRCPVCRTENLTYRALVNIANGTPEVVGELPDVAYCEECQLRVPAPFPRETAG